MTTTSSTVAAERQCNSCLGTGEVGTEAGPMDCPDCGGSGLLAHPNVLVEWRARDIEKARASGGDAVASDFRWLIAELRRARTALTEIAGLAEEAAETEITRRIHFTACQALELYPMGEAT